MCTQMKINLNNLHIYLVLLHADNSIGLEKIQ